MKEGKKKKHFSPKSRSALKKFSGLEAYCYRQIAILDAAASTSDGCFAVFLDYHFNEFPLPQ